MKKKPKANAVHWERTQDRFGYDAYRVIASFEGRRVWDVVIYGFSHEKSLERGRKYLSKKVDFVMSLV